MLRRTPLIIFLSVMAIFGMLALWSALTHGPALPPTLAPNVVGQRLSPLLQCPPHTPCMIHLSATWCPSCRQQETFLEANQLSKAAERHNVHTITVVYKPNDPLPPSTTTTSFIADTKGLMGLSLGAQGFPETFLSNREGIIVYQHKGPIVTLHDAHLLRQALEDLGP